MTLRHSGFGDFGKVLLGGAVAASIARSVRTVTQARRVVPLRETPNTDVTPPKVTVVVPARNEEAVLSDCLHGLRMQTHGAHGDSSLRIVVVDDGSTDSTSAIAQEHADVDRRVHVVRVEGPPPGWSGKVHAMHVGVESAEPPEPGEWLMFVDADTVLAPDLLARLLATAEAIDADLVSAPAAPPPTRSATWSVLMAPGLQMIGENAAPDGRSRKAFAIGHCILLRRSHYEKVGGWAALWCMRNEDIALATVVRDYGGTTRTVNGQGRLTTSGMDPFRQGWASFRKSFVAGTKGSVPILLGGGLGQIALSLAAPAAVAAGIRGRQPTLVAIGAIGWAAQSVAHIHATRVVHASPSLAPVAPATGAVFGGVLLDGAVRVVAGAMAWKGRATRF